MEIKKVPIDKVENWEKNPRGLKKEDFKRLKKQIEKLGVYKPMVAYRKNGKYVVLGGNMRLRALKDLGIKEVDLSIVKVKNEAEKLEYSLSDNDRVGYYEEDALSELIYNHKDELNLEDYKVDLNYEPVALNDLLSDVTGHGETKEDEVPEPPKVAKTKTGDLYIMGNHRLLCGDATNRDDVSRLMDGQKADMVFTDPPYGVSYGDKNIFLNAIDKGNRIQANMDNDTKSVIEMKALWIKAFSIMCDLSKIGACYYICSPQGGEFMMMMMMSILESGWELKQCLIWRKNNFVLGRSDYNYQHEPILYGWKKTSHKFYGSGGESSVWDIDKSYKSDLHPTMKPIMLCSRAIENSTQKAQLVIDVFGGSGSTLIACEQLNRRCYMMEIDPIYCDVIVERWQKFTNREAVLS